MSYLSPPRLHFAGTFFADPSTINNDSRYFDLADPGDDPAAIKAFRDQAWQAPQPDGSGPGGWNPGGSHSFRFLDADPDRVTVRDAVGADGAPVAEDPVLGLRLVTRSQPRDAKLVDLDTDQQLVSMIFGLTVTMRDAAGHVFLEAAMEPVPFTDIWGRVTGGGSDGAAGAVYQSTLTVTRWGDVSTSPFLTQLHTAAGDLLSIKFNVDGYAWTPADPRFKRGRIVGTVGVATAAEPVHTVLGRQFAGSGALNFFPGVVDPVAGKIRLDLGNALPVATAVGEVEDLGELTLGYRGDSGAITPLAPIDYRAAGWYERTAGVVDLPADRALTADELDAVAHHSLLVDGDQAVQSEEIPVHVRADAFVFRLDPEERAVVRLYVTDHGEPHSATVDLALRRPPGLTPDQFAHLSAGLDVPGSVTTDGQGFAEVTLTAHDPGDPRFFSDGSPRRQPDGQVYRVGYRVHGVAAANPWNVVSVLVWNAFPRTPFPAGHQLSWTGEIGAVLRPYGNLFPVMANSVHLDMARYDQVVDRALDIADRLRLPIGDPRYMPVSRDLSGQKKQAVLNWLENPGPDGNPLHDPPAAAAAAPEPEPLAAPPAPATPAVEGLEDARLGGKTSFARRLARAEGVDPLL